MVLTAQNYGLRSHRWPYSELITLLSTLPLVRPYILYIPYIPSCACDRWNALGNGRRAGLDRRDHGRLAHGCDLPAR